MSKEKLEPKNNYSKFKDKIKKMFGNDNDDEKKIIEILNDKIQDSKSEIEDIKDEIPINGGGLYALSETLHSLREANYDRYRKYLKIKSYWANNWTIENDDYLKERLQFIIGVALDYGLSGIKINKNGKFIIYGIMTPTYYWDGRIQKASGIKATPISGISVKFSEELKKENITDKEVAFLKWGDMALPLWFDWWYDIGIINWLNSQFIENAPYNNKKTAWYIKHKNSEIIQLEANAIYNSKNRIIPIVETGNDNIAINAKGETVKSGGLAGKSNKFEKLLDREDVNEDTRNDYDWFRDNAFTWNGIRYNKDNRKSGNSQEEVLNDNVWFNNIEAGYEIEIQNFVTSYNKINKKNAILRKRNENVTIVNKTENNL